MIGLGRFRIFCSGKQIEREFSVGLVRIYLPKMAAQKLPKYQFRQKYNIFPKKCFLPPQLFSQKTIFNLKKIKGIVQSGRLKQIKLGDQKTADVFSETLKIIRIIMDGHGLDFLPYTTVHFHSTMFLRTIMFYSLIPSSLVSRPSVYLWSDQVKSFNCISLLQTTGPYRFSKSETFRRY